MWKWSPLFLSPRSELCSDTDHPCHLLLSKPHHYILRNNIASALRVAALFYTVAGRLLSCFALPSPFISLLCLNLYARLLIIFSMCLHVWRLCMACREQTYVVTHQCREYRWGMLCKPSKHIVMDVKSKDCPICVRLSRFLYWPSRSSRNNHVLRRTRSSLF
ncbi:hypothetical protein EV356DRAFT_218767 [Viridothelium virens]|uniref:Uncharacterized protein n=1 Tax=Viridothelium virens TaxID=1048519 RepID=A0A6A6HMU1_VIRVR|nr:hypothetical protein EV356DRAFT_218767 [Viridothelium virens]